MRYINMGNNNTMIAHARKAHLFRLILTAVIGLSVTGCEIIFGIINTFEYKNIDLTVYIVNINGHTVTAAAVGKTLYAECNQYAVSYEWKKDGAVISGAVTRSLKVTEAGSYRVTVSKDSNHGTRISYTSATSEPVIVTE